MSVEIKFCPSCSHNKVTHEFQDSCYGKFVRVHNVKDAGKGSVCTVCNNGGKPKK